MRKQPGKGFFFHPGIKAVSFDFALLHSDALPQIIALYQWARRGKKTVCFCLEEGIDPGEAQRQWQALGLEGDLVWASEKSGGDNARGGALRSLLTELQKKNIQPSQVLHCGSRYGQDILQPAKLGMRFFYIESNREAGQSVPLQKRWAVKLLYGQRSRAFFRWALRKRQQWRVNAHHKNPPNFAQALAQFQEQNQGHAADVWILAHIAALQKGTCEFFGALQSQLPGHDFFLFSETAELTLSQVQETVNFAACVLPFGLVPGEYPTGGKLPVPKAFAALCEKFPQVKNLCVLMQAQRPGLTRGYAQAALCAYAAFLQQALKSHRPRLVFLWNQFQPFHQLARCLFEKENIPVRFVEFGSLPGTFAVDALGQMGESFVAREAQAFLQLPLSQGDLETARRVQQDLQHSRRNRIAQPIGGIEVLRGRIDRFRPTLVYFGQSDVDAGLVPYTQESRAYHLPCYEGNADILRALWACCQKNQWNLVYKAHPRYRNLGMRERVPGGVIRGDEAALHALIDLADVVVTGVSQTGYEALLRDKALVTVGYNQLRGKGCAYEAFAREALETQLQEALKNRRTAAQKDAFLRHIAAMLRYALYDDGRPRTLRYGMGRKELAQQVRLWMQERE